MVRALVLLLAVTLIPASAGAVTIRDIIELSKAGLPDEVLTAVIDADRTIFTLNTEQILELKHAGVSEAVLLKMLRTRREFEPPVSAAQPVAAAAPAAMPGVVIIGAAPAPPPVTVIVPQYYVVPVAIWGHRPRRVPNAPFLAPEHRGFGRFINP